MEAVRGEEVIAAQYGSVTGTYWAAQDQAGKDALAGMEGGNRPADHVAGAPGGDLDYVYPMAVPPGDRRPADPVGPEPGADAHLTRYVKAGGDGEQQRYKTQDDRFRPAQAETGSEDRHQAANSGESWWPMNRAWISNVPHTSRRSLAITARGSGQIRYQGWIHVAATDTVSRAHPEAAIQS